MKISDMEPVGVGMLQDTDLFAVVKTLRNYKATLGQLSSWLRTNTELLGTPTCPTPTNNSQNDVVANKGYVDAKASSIWVPNTSTQNGYVLASNGQANKVWKTNSAGQPSWQDDVTVAPSALIPAMDGTATAGQNDTYARGDHVHPTDTSRAALNSPTFTGTPKAPTAAKGTNNTQIATTGYVMSAFASPNLTGTPTAPTAAVGTNTTQIATTAHVYAMWKSDHYVPGDKLTNVTCDAYGWFTGGNKNFVIVAAIPKSTVKVGGGGLGITIDKLLLSLRLPTGGYILGSGYDATRYVEYHDGMTTHPSGLSIHLHNSSGWSGYTNNIPLTGSITISCTFK